MTPPLISGTDAWGIGVALTLMLLDIVTGLAKAASKGEVSSGVMRRGLWHKAGFLGALALAVVLDIAQHHIDLGFTVPLIGAVSAYIALTEVSSILENISAMSPELGASGFMKIFANARRPDADAKEDTTGKEDPE